MKTSKSSAKTTVKSTAISSLPVSKKAYAGFIDRIRKVFSFDISRSDMMVAVLDRYLAGDPDAAGGLDLTMRMAFEFLRHDVDLAIRRSARARERARKRREQSGDEVMDQVTFEAELDKRLRKIFTIVNDDDPEAADAELEEVFPIRPLTRRQRRARERAARGKSRYKKLGAAS